MKTLSKIAALAMVSSMALSISAPAQAGVSPLLGEKMTVGFNFCPRGWAEAGGQILPINQNQSLYSLYGTQFGGDGRTSFALPNLRGRSIVGRGQGNGLSDNINIGQVGGSETVQLTAATMPSHTHTGTLLGENAVLADSGNPAGNTLARSASNIYSDSAGPNSAAKMHAGTVAMDPSGGGNQAFNNRNPYLGMLNCVALQGQFPSRN